MSEPTPRTPSPGSSGRGPSGDGPPGPARAGPTLPGGGVLISPAELPPLPDEAITNPAAGRLDPRAWFPRPELPFEIEIGSGKGTFLVQQAARSPEVNFLGIEWAREFALASADRLRRWRERTGTHTNVRVLAGNAVDFIAWRVPDAIVRTIHLYFSDPWPKTKHHKNRVVQHRFLAHAWRVLAPGGELRVVTDHAELWAWDMEHFRAWTEPDGWDVLRENLRGPENPPGRPEGAPWSLLPFDRPESAGPGELVGSNFERKFRKEGRSFQAATLRKNPPA
jgi:tRNA (guanine-N7-)-methyltransferase